MRPYYDEDGITLYNADCREVLPDLHGVGLVLTSPPYNLGGGINGGKWSNPALASGYGVHDDNMPADVYAEWQREVLAMCWATLRSDGAIYYQHKPIIRDRRASLPTEMNPGLPIRQVVIWRRAGGINCSPTHYMPTCEWIVIMAKPEFTLRDRSASGVGDVWEIPQEIGTEHPAPFPLALAARAVETTAAELVVDPFSGSGTTLRAAKDASRRAIGIEIEERFCELAARRLAQRVLF